MPEGLWPVWGPTMADIDASAVIQRLAVRVGELAAQVAVLESALEQAMAEPVVEE